MSESKILQLCVPKVNSASQITEIVSEEKIEFSNGEFSRGTGSFTIFDIFDSLKIEFGNFQKINTRTLSNEVLKIDRDNTGLNIWDPFILKYDIVEAQSPIHLKNINNLLELKITSKSIRVNDLTINVIISAQKSRVNLILVPNNLSHSAKYENETKVVWKLESPKYGSNYTLSFTEFQSSFRIISIESSYLIVDELCSGIFIKKCVLTKNNAKISSIPIILKSKIKEMIIL